MKRKVLFVAHTCCFDTNNGASVACRAMIECLARHGFAAEAVTGSVFEAADEVSAEAFLGGEALNYEVVPARVDHDDASGASGPLLRLDVRGVVTHLVRSAVGRLHEPDEAEMRAFLRMLEATLDRLRPDVVVTYGKMSWRGRSVQRPAPVGGPSPSPCTTSATATGPPSPTSMRSARRPGSRPASTAADSAWIADCCPT